MAGRGSWRDLRDLYVGPARAGGTENPVPLGIGISAGRPVERDRCAIDRSEVARWVHHIGCEGVSRVRCAGGVGRHGGHQQQRHDRDREQGQGRPPADDGAGWALSPPSSCRYWRLLHVRTISSHEARALEGLCVVLGLFGVECEGGGGGHSLAGSGDEGQCHVEAQILGRCCSERPVAGVVAGCDVAKDDRVTR